MTNISMESLPGTRDFYPDDMLPRNWLFNKWHNLSKKFAFKEYDAPILENADLWDKKSGSDILQEMYVFEKAGVKMALRPEMTPSVTRMIINCHKSITLPARWYSVPQCWRYETTARGRRREFYQWNIDIFGAQPIRSEIEIFSILISFLKSVKLTTNDVTIRVSDRRILQEIMDSFGVPADKFVKACNLVDKITKLSKEDLTLMFQEQIGLTSEQIDQIYEIVEITDIRDLKKYIPDSPAVKELEQIMVIFEELGFMDWITFDLSIVRGLAYYTGIVFEGYFKNSELKRAIFGGGRYDNLMATYGADPIPAIGFGMGDVVIMDVLNERGLVPRMSHSCDYLVVAFNDSLFPAAMSIANRMRDQTNYSVETYMGKNRLKIALDYGNRTGVKNVIIVAPDEWQSNCITIKPMTGVTKLQRTITLDAFISELTQPISIPLYAAPPAYNTTLSPSEIMGFSDSDQMSCGSRN